MHIQFTNGINTETFIFEITIGNQIQVQTIQTIPLMAYKEFYNLMTQVANDPRPCKIKISRQTQFWSDLEQVFKTRENSIEFKNRVCEDKV